ncbi:cytochrome b/b6 domain-containing protein [Roseofilum capinflatum]|uniref:Cytochrome b/b6 domain-containing protein n=1 Tax=Roseofilum capinflatum BLCC-M114 TaxID=3022440 RepID=A0ABT7B5X1_9CYAN|nr:cytochrome b/b6 domain-containing protein [Roseofilum capinflatum]MDJ1174569.1 cytochrome b/b6 domain-containing protein [Roseofilum capinflatum BLCC-M114]
MPRSIPYQPVLLRILHGGSALLVILALISGFWVYNTYDGRWGSLPLPNLSDTQDIHGTIAVTFLLLLPIFALYSFHIGYHRLIQEQAFNPLKQVGKPVWWIFMHRLANTFMLLAATFAVITGRMMEEEWLPAGEINRPWYLAHLVSWLIVFLSLALHLLLAAKVGGVPLLRSMLQFSRRDRDTPKSWLRGLRKISSSRLFQGVEIMVMGGIILAFLLPVFAS